MPLVQYASGAGRGGVGTATGALRALPRSGRGRAPHWRFRETDVEAFIRAHPWLYDWKRMDPAHRLRSLAEVIHKTDPWLTLAEAREQSALSMKQLRRLIARDVLPHERRWHGCGPWGQLVVRAADVDELRSFWEDGRRLSGNDTAVAVGANLSISTTPPSGPA